MGERKGHAGFEWGDLWARDHLEDLAVVGSIILKVLSWGAMHWIDLA